MNTFFDDVQFFFLSLFSATTEGSGTLYFNDTELFVLWCMSEYSVLPFCFVDLDRSRT